MKLEAKRKYFQNGNLKELEKLYYATTNRAARARQMEESKESIELIELYAASLKEMLDEVRRGQPNAS